MADLVIDHHTPAPGEFASATFSPCRTYRYSLSRQWSAAPTCVWVMLNPSTADAHVGDNTISRVLGFSRAWGAGGATVVNLYGLRATNPRMLLAHPDPVGPDNDRVIATALSRGASAIGRVVVAWGAHSMVADRAERVMRLLSARGIVPCCLGVTQDGRPRHPLYLRNDTVPQAYVGQPLTTARA